MTGKPQHRSNDQLWWTPCTCAFDRTANYIQARGKISSVNTVTFESVSNRARHQIVARKLAVVRRRVRIMIICGDYYERHLLHCGDVHSFVECSGLHSPFADARQADKIFLSSESLGHQCADGN